MKPDLADVMLDAVRALESAARSLRKVASGNTSAIDAAKLISRAKTSIDVAEVRMRGFSDKPDDYL